jgi:hypothetical protein
MSEQKKTVGVEDLRTCVEELLRVFKPMLADTETYKWEGATHAQYWEFLRRGSLVRQYEALAAALKMGRDGHGHFAVTFLRPAFEELIWIRYLGKHSELASELVRLIADREIAVNLSEQNEYFGVKHMADVGFSQKFVKTYLARERAGQARIREIGRKLGWKIDNRRLLPSTFFLAKAVGSERDYKFLYQGTSRFVHFSTAEILRRIWGQHGRVTISSSGFSRYWEIFSLYWGLLIFVELLNVSADIVGEMSMGQEKWEEIRALLMRFSYVPIITSQELHIWEDPQVRRQPGLPRIAGPR